MITYIVYADYETGERIGTPSFQIEKILENGINDITLKIEVGLHFAGEDDLKIYLSNIFKIRIFQINIDLL